MRQTGRPLRKLFDLVCVGVVHTGLGKLHNMPESGFSKHHARQCLLVCGILALLWGPSSTMAFCVYNELNRYGSFMKTLRINTCKSLSIDALLVQELSKFTMPSTSFQKSGYHACGLHKTVASWLNVNKQAVPLLYLQFVFPCPPIGARERYTVRITLPLRFAAFQFHVDSKAR